MPVVYLIAPQAWAWRQGRVRTMRATIDRLLCIFPFEKEFFEQHGVPTTYIGHPLGRIVKPSLTRAEFCEKFKLPDDRPIVTLLPGSRHGEVARHIPYLIDAAGRIGAGRELTFVLALPGGFGAKDATFSERIRAASIQVIEGSTWDALAHAKLALAASGTVTIEAALLGVPMVTFYRVNALSWILGRWLVRAPFLSMVNLVAGRRIVAGVDSGRDDAGARSRPRRSGCWTIAARARRCGGIWRRSRQSSGASAIRWKRRRSGSRRYIELGVVMVNRQARRNGIWLAAIFAAATALAQDRSARARIDVQSYLIDAQINPAAQTIDGDRAGALHPARRHLDAVPSS